MACLQLLVAAAASARAPLHGCQGDAANSPSAVCGALAPPHGPLGLRFLAGKRPSVQRHTSSARHGVRPSTNPCDKNRVSLSVNIYPQRGITHAALPGPLSLSSAAALIIRARSPRDDRSVCVVHVPDPVVDGSAAHVRGTAVFQAPCSPIRFCCFAGSWPGGSAIRQRDGATKTTRQTRALPFVNNQGKPP